MKIDLRTLGLILKFEDILFSPQDFINKFPQLSNKFKEIFGMNVKEWTFNISDELVYVKLLPLIEEENKVYFVMWDETTEENHLYSLTGIKNV